MSNTKNELYSVLLTPAHIPLSGVKRLLILHGFMGMSDNWKTLGTQFAAQGFEVHLLDMRNHGRSFHSEEFSYTVMVQDVLEYCQAHHLDSVDIIGHSMGGKIAMLFATTYPEIVNKIVVVDIGPKYYRPHHQDILRGLNAVDFSVQPSRNDIETILIKYIPETSTRQFLMKNLYWVTPGQLGFRFNLKVFNEKVEQIGTALDENAFYYYPTLFLRGGNSSYIKDNDYSTIMHHFPKAEIITIPEVGHWLHAENPVAFFEIVIDFLKA